MIKKETFTQLVKEEVASLDYPKEMLLPLLSGFIKVNMSLSFINKERTLILRTENNKVAKLIYNALKECFHIPLSFKYSQNMKLNKRVVYYIFVTQKIDYILKELEIRDGLISTYPKNLIQDKNLTFFIAGVFLASGSVNSPESTNYHLQMLMQEEEDAKYMIRLLNKFKHDNLMEFKIVKYRKKYMIYLKKADQISTFLSVIGAQNCMFELENARIEKDYINSENRYTICFTANYQKTLEKAMRQIEDINKIYKNKALSLLNEKELALCELRVNNAEASLTQLVQLLKENYNIVLSKSGVNHLFNSIHEKSQKLN